MASGTKYGLTPSPPGSSAATPDTITGASSPAETVPVYDFSGSAATTTYMDFYGTLEGYASGGLTLKIKWSASTATTGDTVWQAAFRRVADDAEDLDTTAHTYVFNTVTATAPSAVGEVSYDNITFTDGADMDSLADGEMFILRLLRDTAHASDNMAGDAELHWPPLLLRET